MSESLNALPIIPVIAFFFARGWALTEKMMPVLVALIAGIEINARFLDRR